MVNNTKGHLSGEHTDNMHNREDQNHMELRHMYDMMQHIAGGQ